MSATVQHASFWAGTPALLAVAFGCALLVTLALLALLWPRLRRPDVRARVGRFTVPPAPPTLQPAAAFAGEAPAREWGDRLFGGGQWWGAFKEKLELARIERPAGEIVLVTTLATLAAAVVLSLMAGTPVLAIPILGLGPAAMLAIVNQRLARQRRQFREQLPSHLQELASAMRAGHSLVSGLRTIASSAAEPMRTELQRVLADEQLGVPLDAALAPMARRMASDDVKQVALVAALHERTGGNMAAVLDQVAEGVRERMELRRELESLTAQARLSRWVVTLLPPALMLVISIENGSYLRPLFHTSAGVLLLLVAFGMVVAGSLAMKAIVNVEA
ncbi:MAG TPA: type II secretion system F family protein [Solirubrobacteraceae bacterium]|jgi:tight adherence protein B|nr:type II secretion system F family protein [Solirubrobacteraceae bacterium]